MNFWENCPSKNSKTTSVEITFVSLLFWSKRWGFCQERTNLKIFILRFLPLTTPDAMFPNPSANPHSSSTSAGDPPAASLVFPHTVAGRASAAPEPVKRKRGRPRKYGAQLSSSLSRSPPPPSSSSPRKKELSALSPKKAQLAALGEPLSWFIRAWILGCIWSCVRMRFFVC